MNQGMYGLTKDRKVLYRYWDQLAPPENSHSLDDEFIGSYSGKWTIFDQNGNLTISPLSGLIASKGIKFSQATSAGQQVAGLYMPIPAGDYTFMTRVNVSWPLGTGGNWGGIAYWEDPTSASGDIYAYALNSPSTARALRIMVARWTQWNNYGADVSTLSNSWGNSSLYLRIRRSGSNYYADYSTAGNSWINFAIATPTFTPTYVGPFISNAGSGETLDVTVDFWRYLPRSLVYGEREMGRFLNAYGEL